MLLHTPSPLYNKELILYNYPLSKAVPRRAPVVAVLLGASVAGLSYTASAKERHVSVLVICGINNWCLP